MEYCLANDKEVLPEMGKRVEWRKPATVVYGRVELSIQGYYLLLLYLFIYI